MSFVLGKKLRMGQVWEESKVVPVTFVKVEPNTVSILRTKEKDGYEAVQLGAGKARREFRVQKTDGLKEFKAGDTLTVASFKTNDVVRVSGTSKGRGFQGVVKRHGFHGGPKTHGQKNRFRAPGSIGSTAPQHIPKGRRMAGRMGGERVTIKKVRVVHVLPDENLLVLKGAVPGAPGGLLEISKIKNEK